MKLLLIDNYDSFVYNIAQYVGELGASLFIYRNDEITMKQVEKLQPDRIILSPGPGTPVDKRYFGICLSLIKKTSRQTPTLGICLGHQGIVHAFNGQIGHAQQLMHGKTSQILHDGKGIYKGILNPFEATRYHSLVAESSSIPLCLQVTAHSMEDNEIMGVRHIQYPIEGIQFHPESILTNEGKKILKNFLDGV